MFSQEEKWLLEEGFGNEKSEAFFVARQQLATGTPLAYIIGHVPFLDCKIYLDSKPLIPRPETEFWTETVINKIQLQESQAKHPLKILDLCAGSGCIGIAIASNCQNTLVDFTELDNHQSTILKNCQTNNLPPDRYQIFKSDLFHSLPTTKYDYILSNPPYIDKTLCRTEPSVTDNEPELALFGGKDGLSLITKIIKKAPQFLNHQGELWLEHEPEQIDNIQTQAKDAGFTVTNHQDQYHNHRFSRLVLQ